MIDTNLIMNMVIALFLYNIILRSIGQAIMKQFMKSDVAKKEKKSFEERVKEKTKVR